MKDTTAPTAVTSPSMMTFDLKQDVIMLLAGAEGFLSSYQTHLKKSDNDVQPALDRIRKAFDLVVEAKSEFNWPKSNV